MTIKEAFINADTNKEIIIILDVEGLWLWAKKQIIEDMFRTYSMRDISYIENIITKSRSYNLKFGKEIKNIKKEDDSYKLIYNTNKNILISKEELRTLYEVILREIKTSGGFNI